MNNKMKERTNKSQIKRMKKRKPKKKESKM